MTEQHRDHAGRFTRTGEIVAIDRLYAKQAATAARMGLYPHPPAPITSEPGSKPSLDGGLRQSVPTGRSQATEDQARRDLAQSRAEGVPNAPGLGEFLRQINE